MAFLKKSSAIIYLGIASAGMVFAFTAWFLAGYLKLNEFLSSAAAFGSFFIALVMWVFVLRLIGNGNR